MTRIFYDCEFLEDGRTIELISIGMVREDGAELYRVINSVSLITSAWRHPWLRENVVAHLPVREDPYGHVGGWNWDRNHPDYPALKTRDLVAAEVRDFILGVPDPQLWAYYAATDFVALYQLWGPLVNRPEGIPVRVNDLAQEADRLGVADLPSLPGATEHNALSDAREVRYRYQWLTQHGGAA